jgi:hypothetical protein
MMYATFGQLRPDCRDGLDDCCCAHRFLRPPNQSVLQIDEYSRQSRKRVLRRPPEPVVALDLNRGFGQCHSIYDI